EVASVKAEGFAREKVRCHAAERDRQIVEILNVRVRSGFTAEQKNERLRWIQTGRKREAFRKLQRIPSGDAIPFLLLRHRTIFKLGSRPQEVFPVCFADDLFEGSCVVSGRIQAAKQPAYTRAGDPVHGNAMLLQISQHADLGEAQCSAPAQSDSDDRTPRWGILREG